jgi:hypothetical protein
MPRDPAGQQTDRSREPPARAIKWPCFRVPGSGAARSRSTLSVARTWKSGTRVALGHGEMTLTRAGHGTYDDLDKSTTETVVR